MPTPDERIDRLERRISSLVLGIKIFLLILVIAAALLDLFATLSIGTFKQIFADALPGKPLPILTLTVIQTQYLLLAACLLWPTLGVVAVFMRKSDVLPLVLVCTALACAALQHIIIVLALFLPMVGLVTGMAADPP